MARLRKAGRSRYFTDADGRALVADWRKSGLTVSEYCRTYEITRRRLIYWRKKVESDRFVELVVGESGRGPRAVDTACETGEAIEIVLGEVVIRFPDRPGMAGEILSALAGGTR